MPASAPLPPSLRPAGMTPISPNREGGALRRGEGQAILADRKVSEAQELLHHHQIDELPVIDGTGKLLGHLDVQDLLCAGTPEC